MWRCILHSIALLVPTVAAYNDTEWILVPAVTRNELDAGATTSSNATTNESINPFPAILGGTPAGTDEFQWFGRTDILYRDSFGNLFGVSCGASLIHGDFVVSASHCIVDIARSGNPFSVTLNLGANRFDGSDGIALAVESVIYPTNYVFPFNDLVLYKLRGTTNVAPVPWNTNALTPLDGAIGTAIGFGLTSDDGAGSAILLKVNLPAITNSRCLQFYAAAFVPDSITCVYAERQGKDICQGDSGGPIISANGVLYGVTSFSGETCGASPSGFTRTSYLSNFISSVSTCCYGLVQVKSML